MQLFRGRRPHNRHDLEVLGHPPQAHRLGRHKQRAALDARLAVDRLDAGVDPDLAAPLAPLLGRQRLLRDRPGAQDVEVGRQRRPLVGDVEVCREQAPGPSGREVPERRARRVLVQQGGDGPAVDHARPADGPRAEVHHRDDLARRGVVEDVLVGADAAGAGQGPRGYALRAGLGGDALVGLVVERGPLRVREEVLHHGQLGGGGADVAGEGGVYVGAWEEGRRRGEDGADGGACCEAEEEEYRCGCPAGSSSARWRWVRLGGGWLWLCRAWRGIWRGLLLEEQSRRGREAVGAERRADRSR